MLRGVGFTKEDLHKPIIGIANTWTEIGPCNYHLRDIAEAVKEGIRAAGGTPMEFNTVTISDGITMGTEGMKASLISRDMIADSIELVARGNAFDGLVCIAGCDKNMPGAIMALARLDIPGLMLYGGSIAPGHMHVGADGKTPDPATAKTIDITIQQVFEAIGAHAAGKITDAQLEEAEATACPGPGACGGQFTANTMAMAGEFLGISPIQLTGVPAMSAEKHAACREAGKLVMDLARAGLKPSQIMTRESLEDAIAAVCASGGSTNAVLHLIAIANELDIPLTVDDFDIISEKTPFICDLQPGGKYVAKRLPGRRRLPPPRPAPRRAAASSTATPPPSPARPSAKKPRSPKKPQASTSSTPGRTRSSPPAASSSSRAISPPKAASSKSPATSASTTPAPPASSTAKTSASPPSNAGKINPNDVLVIRYEGPRGGPGMREMLAVTAAIKGIPELSETVALLTDGRFSGATRRPHGRPRRPRSPTRRPHRRRPRRRHHHLRHPQPQPHPQRPRRRNRRPPRNPSSPRTPLQTRRLRQVRQLRKQRQPRSRHHI